MLKADNLFGLTLFVMSCFIVKLSSFRVLLSRVLWIKGGGVKNLNSSVEGIPSSGTPCSTCSKLKDTVKPYDRHIILCTGNLAWSSKIEEDSSISSIARLLNNSVDRTKLTACDQPSDSPNNLCHGVSSF